MTEVTETADVRSEARQLGGKYLTFILAEEIFGVEILKVREIIGMMDITAIPRTPEYVRGVINLRGKVITIVDLRSKFGIEEAEQTEQTCIIVMYMGDMEVGVVVDQVSEVLDIVSEDIDPAPSFGTSVNTEFILGMAKSEGNVSILLDIGKVLAGEDWSAVTEGEDRCPLHRSPWPRGPANRRPPSRRRRVRWKRCPR